jgi:hypothetical protein
VINGWLLDTNIPSELRRPKAERKVIQPGRRPNPETMPGLC